MKNFHMVVLERLKIRKETFFTEPFEVGWADEAIFFVKIHEINADDAVVSPIIQISADGIDWVDFESKMPIIHEKGTHYKSVRDFGGWLRLKCEISGRDPEIKVTVQLALKG